MSQIGEAMSVAKTPKQDTREQDLMSAATSAALTSMEIEAQSITVAAGQLEGQLSAAVQLIRDAAGRVIVSGIGKSGLVGRKIAATLASTGTPSFFLHSTEALHGDAGMVSAGDIAVLISNSGETAEVCQFAWLLSEREVPVIAMTADDRSSLAELATVVLPVGVEREADPLELAPTASAIVAMAVGDALAAALMVVNQFGPADFSRNHPGGSLGRQLASLKDEP